MTKSKFAKAIFSVVLGAVVLASAASANAYSFTAYLKPGVRNADVMEMQKLLNTMADTMIPATPTVAGSLGYETTYYGSKTVAALKRFQAKYSLAVDGLVGPITRAKLNIVSNGYVSGNFAPAGCTSAAGYSPITGGACYSIPSVPTGLPAGCTSTAGFSPTTGLPCNGTPAPVVTGPIAATAATDMPASGSFIAPASGVAFAKFTFSGTGTVTSVKLQRTGVSSSATLSNVYLYDGATRLTDGASISSDNTVTFNALGGIFTVAGSKTITVVADTLVADYSLGFNLIGFTANGAASTVNIAGNQMYGASATLAIVTMSSATGSGATDAGLDISVWQGTATVATRDVVLKSLALRQIGSIAAADIKNFKLYADGVLISTVANLDVNGYVTFTPNTTLKTGARILKVTADVIGGAGRTVQMSLRGSYDIAATDTQYNANGTAAGTFPFGPSSFTVNAGTLTVVKATNSPSTSVTLGASDQNVATYTFTAYGEPVKVETLRVGMITTGGTASTNTLRNVRILVNGAQVGSNTSVPAENSFATDSGTSFTTNFVVYPGTPTTVEIHSDIYDNEGTDDIAAGTTTAVQAVLIAATGNAVPQTSLGTIAVPSANKNANNLTISQGTMSLAKTSNYTSRTIAVPVTAYKIGSFQLSGNSTEAVNLNTIYVGFADTTSDAAPATDLSDLYVVYDGVMTPVKGTVTCVYSAGCTNANSWSINKTLAVNGTMSFDVYATIASTLSTNSFITTLAVAGTTASSGIATYADASGTTTLTAGFSGQEITGGTGSITATLDASRPDAAINDDAGTKTMAAFKFAAITDTYTVTDLTFTVADVTTASTISLYDGATLVASKAVTATTTFSGLSWVVPAGQSKVLTVKLDLAAVGTGMGSTGASTLVTLTAFTSQGSDGTTDISANDSGQSRENDPAGTAQYTYKAIPTLALGTLPTTALVAGTNTLSKFSINTNGTGTIGWGRIIFSLTKTTNPTIANGAAFTLWNADSNTQIAGTATVRDTSDAATCLTVILACRVTFVPTSEQQISGSVNYVLKATVAGSLATSDYISTSIAAPSVFAASDDYTAVAASGSFAQTYAGYGTSPSFIWSDVSGSGHDIASTTVTDWSNDYLVRTLPLDSQTLTK